MAGYIEARGGFDYKSRECTIVHAWSSALMWTDKARSEWGVYFSPEQPLVHCGSSGPCGKRYDRYNVSEEVVFCHGIVALKHGGSYTTCMFFFWDGDIAPKIFCVYITTRGGLYP